jgi:hypothetical protein
VLANWQNVKTALDILADIVILLGIPTGLFQFRRAVKKEQQDRAYVAYDAVDKEYLEFERLCFHHPRLDISGIDNALSYCLTPEEQKQERIALMLLISMFERAFLMYHDQPIIIKQRQWSGWKVYIDIYCKRENFRKAWHACGETFDSEFRGYMKDIVPPSATSSSS